MQLTMVVPTAGSQLPFDEMGSLHSVPAAPPPHVRVPWVLRDINIILISKSNPSIDVHSADVVWNGFDLLHCCVSWKVGPDLSYNVFGSDAALSAIRSQVLVMQRPALYHLRSCLPRQLVRILKYVQRGFRFQHAASAAAGVRGSRV